MTVTHILIRLIQTEAHIQLTTVSSAIRYTVTNIGQGTEAIPRANRLIRSPNARTCRNAAVSTDVSSRTVAFIRFVTDAVSGTNIGLGTVHFEATGIEALETRVAVLALTSVGGDTLSKGAAYTGHVGQLTVANKELTFASGIPVMTFTRVRTDAFSMA